MCHIHSPSNFGLIVGFTVGTVTGRFNGELSSATQLSSKQQSALKTGNEVNLLPVSCPKMGAINQWLKTSKTLVIPVILHFSISSKASQCPYRPGNLLGWGVSCLVCWIFNSSLSPRIWVPHFWFMATTPQQCLIKGLCTRTESEPTTNP